MSTIHTASAPPGTAATLDIQLTLDEPQTRLVVRSPTGTLGRAEALLDDARSWSAKHYWTEGTGAERTTVFEFDEPLPAGPVLLRVPYRG